MSEQALTFEGEPEEGYVPAYGQIEGEKGDKGDQGRTGDKGDTGQVGGGPEWEGIYDLVNVPLSQAAIDTAPQFTKLIQVNGQETETAQWAFFEIPTPGPEPVNPGLNPGDPGYAEVMDPYFAALAAWKAAVPVPGFDDVELGLWIEAEPGIAPTWIELGLRGPDGGVYFGTFNLEARDAPLGESTYGEQGHDRSIGYDAIDPDTGDVLEHRLAWWGDELADRYVTGKMRRFNRLDQTRGEDGVYLDDYSAAGWAGPERELRFQVPNQMQDCFSRASWNGVWDMLTNTGPSLTLGDGWFLAVRLNGGFGLVPDKVRIRCARLKLQRYRRRLKQVKQGFRRFQAIYLTDNSGRLRQGNGPDAVRGYSNFLHNPNAPGGHHDKAVTVPAHVAGTGVGVGPGNANGARWVNWQSGAATGEDANNHLTDGLNGRPSYAWFFKLPRPVLAIVEAGASWSRYQPRTESLLNGTPDIGQSVALELWVGQEGHEVPSLVLDRDIITIERATQRLDHRIGPKICIVQSVALLAYNFTTQARDLRSLDDDAYLIQSVGPEGETTTALTPIQYAMPHWTHAWPPYIWIQEIPGAEHFPGSPSPQSGMDDEAYRPFVNPGMAYTGPR